MRKLLLLAAAPLVAAFVVPVASPAHAQVEVPDDCAVPAEINLEDFNVIIGTDQSEVLVGTNGDDFFCGRLGNDVVIALGGNDLILSDTTTFFGVFDAEGGNDLVLAGAGDDEILPGPGNDVVRGGPGDDFLALAQGNDLGDGGLGTTTFPADPVTTWSTVARVTTSWPASCPAGRNPRSRFREGRP